MAFYRVYNVDSLGLTLGFKAFDADCDSDACDRARMFRQNDKWFIAELREGSREVACPLGERA
jgi:hypothetical protein